MDASDGAMTLAVVEILDRDGQARVAVPVRRWPVTIGRAVECDVVLDDPHVAPRHATLTDHDGVLELQVGETVNGVRLGKRRLDAQSRTSLAPGDVCQIGNTRVRVRRASDALAPERPYVPQASGRRLVLALTVAFTAWNAAELWIHTDPGSRVTDYLPVIVGAPVAIALWSGFWAVGSKLVRHRFDFLAHARIALVASLAVGLVGLILPLTAFVSGWAFPSRVAPVVASAIGWGTVGAHIGRILPGRPRVLAGVMATFFVAGAALFATHHYQAQDRVFPELYVTTLAPPAFRLAPPISTGRFIDESRALKAVLDSHVSDDDPGDSLGE